MSDKNTYAANIDAFSARFVDLSGRLMQIDPERIGILPARDGGVCYAFRGTNGRWGPITDPVAPAAAAQKAADEMQHRLQSEQNPVVILGNGVGYEFDAVYSHFTERLADNEPFRRIYVIIDSIPALSAWMKGDDRREILANDKIEFYWHEDTRQIAMACKADTHRSHLFIPISSMPEAFVVRCMTPLTDLFLERRDAQEELETANQSSYAA